MGSISQSITPHFYDKGGVNRPAGRAGATPLPFRTMKNTTFVVSLFLSCGLAIAQESKPAEAPKPAAAPAAPVAAPAPAAPLATIGKPLDYFETTELTTVATGQVFTEGPLWWNGKLLFCDLGGKISTIAPGESAPTVIRENADQPAGAALDLEGRLLITHMKGGSISRTAADGTVTTLIDTADGKKLGRCNDLVVRADGSIYATDFAGGADNRNLIRVAPDGKATILPSSFKSANGLAFSPDQSILYVADFGGKLLKAFDVAADGSVSNERVFIDFKDEYANASVRGNPDGVKVDSAGNVYCTGPGGIWVLSPKGEKLARLNMNNTNNIAFGGDDNKTLFICATTKVFSVKTKIAGAARKAAKPAEAKPASTPATPIEKK